MGKILDPGHHLEKITLSDEISSRIDATGMSVNQFFEEMIRRGEAVGAFATLILYKKRGGLRMLKGIKAYLDRHYPENN
jgi:hypothetical protein